MPMTNMKDIKAKSDRELEDLIAESREKHRTERFKDQFSRKKSVMDNAKKTTARALTELNARRSNPETK